MQSIVSRLNIVDNEDTREKEVLSLSQGMRITSQEEKIQEWNDAQVPSYHRVKTTTNTYKISDILEQLFHFSCTTDTRELINHLSLVSILNSDQQWVWSSILVHSICIVVKEFGSSKEDAFKFSNIADFSVCEITTWHYLWEPKNQDASINEKCVKQFKDWTLKKRERSDNIKLQRQNHAHQHTANNLFY